MACGSPLLSKTPLLAVDQNSEKSFLDLDGMPSEVVYRPEALDCQEQTAPETCNGLMLGSPSGDLNLRPPASEG